MPVDTRIPTAIRLFSCVITAIPAAMDWMLLSLSAGSDYFWKAYFITGRVYLVVSLVIGYLIPSIFPKQWKNHPVLFLSTQGLLAWTVALLAIAVINLTPLCIGRDNGDGNNGLALCVLQTVAVTVVYSPLQFILLFLTALPGGWLCKRVTARLTV